MPYLFPRPTDKSGQNMIQFYFLLVSFPGIVLDQVVDRIERELIRAN